jgi:hypothetical protein
VSTRCRRSNGGAPQRPLRFNNLEVHEETTMSKGMNQKREQKRKPAKSLEEKRAAKKAKKADRASARTL